MRIVVCLVAIAVCAISAAPAGATLRLAKTRRPAIQSLVAELSSRSAPSI